MSDKSVHTLTAKELRSAKDIDAYIQAVCLKLRADDLLFIEDAAALALITTARKQLSAYAFILLSRHMLQPLSQNEEPCYEKTIDIAWHYQCIDALLLYKGGAS